VNGRGGKKTRRGFYRAKKDRRRDRKKKTNRGRGHGGEPLRERGKQSLTGGRCCQTPPRRADVSRSAQTETGREERGTACRREAERKPRCNTSLTSNSRNDPTTTNLGLGSANGRAQKSGSSRSNEKKRAKWGGIYRRRKEWVEKQRNRGVRTRLERHGGGSGTVKREFQVVTADWGRLGEQRTGHLRLGIGSPMKEPDKIGKREQGLHKKPKDASGERR